MKRTVYTWMLTLLTVFGATVASADEKVSFEVKAPMVVAKGEAVRVEFSLNASPDEGSFTAPSFEGFDVIAGPAFSQGSSIQIVNVQMTRSSNYTITYVLLPQQEGRITLPAPEIVVDQPLRQRMFDTQATTDDHVMHIVGTAVDSLGNSYYKVKNSWGERAGRHGYWYASPAYVAGKTIELVLPRAALGVDPGDDAFRIER